MNQCKLNIGDVVLSKKGRDANNYFMVVAIENSDFVYVSDGKKHALAKPKKKNVKHLSYANANLDGISDKLQKGLKVFDSEVKSALRQFNEPSQNN